MNLINKTYKQALFFLMLFAFLTQQAIANDDKAEVSNEYEIYKINKSPIVNFWKLTNSLPDYTKLHLDYFADECKQTLIVKFPFLLTLMTNCIVSAYFGIENSSSMFYLSCKLLLLNFFLSGCNTLLKPNQFIQFVSLIFYGFDEYIFPLYSLYSVSNSYIEKLGRNGCIPACLYGIAGLKSLLISRKTRHANIANIHTIITKSSLDIQPKMHLLSKLIEHKDNMFLYSASLKLKNKDNLISKFSKWIASHTDDISLSNINDLALKKNSIEITEADEMNRINNAKKIKVDDILAMNFYNNPIFIENCKLKQKVFAKCQNYMCHKYDDKLDHITSKNKNLVFIPVDNLQSNNSKNYLITLLNKYKAIVVEVTRQKFAPQETIVTDEHKCFGVVNNKGIYYLFLGFNFTDRNNTTFTRLLHTLPQTLFWCLALGNLSFSYQPCLIIKFANVDKLIDILKILIASLSYDIFKINIFGVSKLNKKKHNEN